MPRNYIKFSSLRQRKRHTNWKIIPDNWKSRCLPLETRRLENKFVYPHKFLCFIISSSSLKPNCSVCGCFQIYVLSIRNFRQLRSKSKPSCGTGRHEQSILETKIELGYILGLKRFHKNRPRQYMRDLPKSSKPNPLIPKYSPSWYNPHIQKKNKLSYFHK